MQKHDGKRQEVQIKRDGRDITENVRGYIDSKEYPSVPITLGQFLLDPTDQETLDGVRALVDAAKEGRDE